MVMLVVIFDVIGLMVKVWLFGMLLNWNFVVLFVMIEWMVFFFLNFIEVMWVKLVIIW